MRLISQIRRTMGSAHVLLAAFCFMGSTYLVAQDTSAKIVGSVTDASAAALPETSITITSVETGIARSTTSNGVGIYEFSFLPVGRYTVTATRAGFQKLQVSQFVLTVGQVARLDITMTVGQVSESVEVSASALALQTENASVGTVIDSAQVEQLPLNGRSFVQLATLTPGVLTGTPGSITSRRNRGSLGQDVAMSAAGSRDTQNRFYFDGVEAMDLDSYNFSFSPSIDAIEEFKVHTSGFSSEMGGAPGGQVNLTTKSGGNQFHGTLWEFNRNDATAALAPFEPYDPNAKAPKLNRNQFGANLGGPVIKNRTFFFFNWESGRQVAGSFGGTALLPPAAYRTGDFSGLSTALYDPTTGKPFAGNMIPASRIQNYAKTFLDKFVPQTNTDEDGINFRGKALSAPNQQDQYMSRVDHRFTDRHTLSGTYMYNTQSDDTVGTFGWDTRGNRARAQIATLSDVLTLTPRMVNELRLGWHRFSEQEFFGTTDKSEYDIANIIGIAGVSKNPRDFGAPFFDAGYTLPGTQNEGPRNRINQNWEVNDSLSYTVGKHFLKVGASITRRNWTYDEGLNPRGSFEFDGLTTSGPSDPTEANSFAAFLLGNSWQASLSATPYATRMNNWWQAYYLQDDWKVRSNLTVNLGLRYEYFSSPNQRGPMSNFDLNGAVPGFIASRQTFLGVSGISDTSGVPTNLVQAPKNGFGPRFGFAYTPSRVKDFVVRGGYGLFFSPEVTNSYTNLTLNPPIIVSKQFTGSFDDTVNPGTVFTSSAASDIGGGLDGAAAMDPYIRNTYSQNWNLTIQKRLPANIYLEVAYVGTAGKNLSLHYDGNRPIALVVPGPGVPSVGDRRPLAGFDVIDTVKNIGQSSYHSFQTKLERRVSSGLTFLAAYTWAHALDNSDMSTLGGGSYAGKLMDIFNLPGEKGGSAFDVRHRFSTSVMYDLPGLHNAHPVVRSVAGGWQVGAIGTLQSGFASTVVGGGQTTGTGVSSRPQIAQGQQAELSSDERSREHWFNTAAFSIPALGQFGNATRGNVHLPGVELMDLIASKNFRIGERVGLQFRSEFFNALNHVNLGAPGLNVRAPASFGLITSANLGAGATNPGRTIQFGLKLRF
ncbi:MAG: TonB-dependent receptor [Bryobacteraceae bacterium]